MIHLGFTQHDTNEFASNAICTDVIPTYTNSISVILKTNCSRHGCHNSRSAKGQIDLSNYKSAKHQFLNFSNTLNSVHQIKGYNAMPIGSKKLSPKLLNQLDCWVKNGCPE